MSEDKHFKDKHTKLAQTKLKSNRRLIDKLNISADLKAEFKFIIEKELVFTTQSYGELERCHKLFDKKLRINAEAIMKDELNRLKDTFYSNVTIVRKMNLSIEDETSIINTMRTNTTRLIRDVIRKQIEILSEEQRNQSRIQFNVYMQELEELTSENLEISNIYHNPLLTLRYVKEHIDFDWDWEDLTFELKLTMSEFYANKELPWHKPTLAKYGGVPRRTI